MKSYESSTATLRAILAHPSLQRDKVDETMDAMASANADAKEVDDAIRVGVEVAQADTGIDDGELEDELQKLIQETQDEQAKAEEEKALEELREKLASVQMSSPPRVVPVIQDRLSPPERTEPKAKEAA